MKRLQTKVWFRDEFGLTAHCECYQHYDSPTALYLLPGPGYTCPTCFAPFTCLKFYQQHMSWHAEANGTKLFCCNRCRYSTDSSFQFNWHLMSHKGTKAHSCRFCQDKSLVDIYKSKQEPYVKQEENEEDEGNDRFRWPTDDLLIRAKHIY